MSLLSLNLPLPEHGPTNEVATGDAADVATATSAIAELRRQLAAPGMLAHPAVCRELHKLDEQLNRMHTAAGRTPGRHRAARGRPLPDHGTDLQPADKGEHDEPDRAGPAGDRAPQAARPC